jgi:signal transduction histidine kinase/ActR/RegA family two-component response regulator
MLRLAGFLLLILAIYLHNRYLLDQDHPQIAAGYAAVTLTYSLASWALLYLLYRGPGCPLCDFLLGLDLVFFTGAIWISGGPQSWLFPALILRPADQLAGGFRRVVFFGLLSAACYAAMLALWGQPPGPRGFTILVLILAANFYLALIARTVEGMRRRTRQAMRLARESVAQLQAHLEERERLEQERIRAQKLESLAVLAGGLGHDFSNYLTALLLNLTLLKGRPGLDPEVKFTLGEMEAACRRAQALTRQLVTFARKSPPRRTVFPPEPLVRETVGLVLRGPRAACEIRIQPGLLNLEGDDNQISQVLQNLLLNAAEALPQKGPITCEARNLSPAEVARLGLDPLRPWIRLTVSDQGPGIPPENLERIFDPYFSTKPRGSGLGLAMAHSIVSRHGGFLRVESAAGVGTTFHVDLPATSAPPSPLTPPETPLADRGRVLVMDDDEDVRRVVGRMLRQLGYEVHFARDGRELLEVYQASQDGWQAVIMNLSVPEGMGGREAIERLRQIDPGVRALITSGYLDHPVMIDCRAYGFRASIPKPFTLAELSRALDEALTPAEP